MQHMLLIFEVAVNWKIFEMSVNVCQHNYFECNSLLHRFTFILYKFYLLYVAYDKHPVGFTYSRRSKTRDPLTHVLG